MYCGVTNKETKTTTRLENKTSKVAHATNNIRRGYETEKSLNRRGEIEGSFLLQSSLAA
ncbi:MAG: hypothetical protein ACI8RD_003941 [Bacillariaceae sp.]|jgi:hypothetical protein